MSDAGVLSSLTAAPGSAAAAIASLGQVMFLGAALVFLIVTVLALAGVWTRAYAIDGRRWLVFGGLALPSVTLAALFVHAAPLDMSAPGPDHPDLPRIEVIGRQWWWEVRYGGANDTERSFVTANELRIPVGRPVSVALTSADVIHGFWVPALAGKVDMIPGRTNRIVLRSDAVQVYRGQCAEYCGGQHGLMAFTVVATSPADFEQWLATQVQPARVDDGFVRGYARHHGRGHQRPRPDARR
jgi:cytochrome c oxidase subunit II